MMRASAGNQIGRLYALGARGDADRYGYRELESSGFPNTVYEDPKARTLASGSSPECCATVFSIYENKHLLRKL
jgi:hypothetical protein